ncbi:STAS domain-containing protein [Microtetraspora sp. NBRC 13810]|uniref:STAS domain-containing protein n=1 Tax=Microtetraspora sp. NBRC 13810 TaxID=3030990 RepID=UPI002556A037|nr:STAS domain-containing protein [Microtetraspora sp. NBRC 13810]
MIDSTVRLRLDPALRRRGTMDGAWWPHSRDAAAELPGLIAAVDQRLGRMTLRVGLHPDAWDNIPRRLPARGRQVRVGWFRHTDPHLISLIPLGAEPIMLLVIPPGSAAGPAAAALSLAARGTPGLRPADILTAAQRSTTGTGTPEGDGPAEWENEGGHIIDQRPRSTRQARAGRYRHRPATAERPPHPTTTSSLMPWKNPMAVPDTFPFGVPDTFPLGVPDAFPLGVPDAFPLGRGDRSASTTVHLSGEIDLLTSPALRERLLAALRSSASLLILDLSGVSFCDASGLAVLVGIQRRARPMGITLALAAPRPHMSKLLRITGLDRHLPVTA